jgi:anti-sigma B factor antagonist
MPVDVRLLQHAVLPAFMTRAEGLAMDDPASTPEQAANCCPACGNSITAEPLASAGDNPCPHCDHLLWFVRRSGDGVVVLTFLPGLMLASESRERIDDVTDALRGSSQVILDLSQLQILSSIFLGLLVALHRRIESTEGKMKICGLQPDVREVFKMTKLEELLDIREDEQEARASF